MILLINQAILVPEVDQCLLCPMQCRINGVVINEVPRFSTSNPTTSSHSIVIADPTDDAHQYTILLQLEGVVSYFKYTLPTSAEYNDENIPHLELTAECPAWEPYNDDFPLQEESHLDFRRHLISAARSDGPCCEAEQGDRYANMDCEEEPHWKLSPVSLQYNTAVVHDDDNLGVALEASVQVSSVKTCLSPETYDVCNVHTGKRQGAWTTSLWPIVGKFHLKKPRTWCNVRRNGVFVLSCIPLCQGISVLMIGCFAIGECRVTSIVTHCSAQRSHQPEATRWCRSSRLTLDGAEATPCHTRAKPMMLLVSFLHGREYHQK